MTATLLFQNGGFLYRRSFSKTLLFFLVILCSFSAQAQCDLTLTPANITEATCGGKDGSFQVQVGGIAAPFQYVLYKEVAGDFVSQESGTLIAGTPVFVGLTAGRYKYAVNKDGTCSGDVIVDVTQAALTMTPANIHNPTCGGKEGSFQVDVTGIVAPYQYILYKEEAGEFVLQENGTLIAGTLTMVGLRDGRYKVAVSKGGTCSGEVTVELTQDELTMTPTGIRNPTCGGKEGSFQVGVTGIVAPYQYGLYKEIAGDFVLQENGTLIAGTLTLVGLNAGNYKVAVSKGGTCSGEVTVELTQDELTMSTSGIKNPTCGGKDGFFQVPVTGIVAPYQYVLSKEVAGDFVLQENGTLIAGTLTFVGLTAGNYKVAVSKGGTCSGDVTVELTQDELTMTPSGIRNPTCGGKDGFFQVPVTGIVAPYQYVLSKEVAGDFVLQENGTLIAGTLTFIGLAEGKYKVAITKGGTCSGEAIVELKQDSLTMTPINITQPASGSSNGSFAVQAGGIVAPYQYALYKQVSGNFVLQENGTLIAGNPTFIGLAEGTYKVAITKAGTCSGEVFVYLASEVIGKEACGQGYWVNNVPAWKTTNFRTSQTLESVFDVPDAFGLDNRTLLQALKTGGGSSLAGSAAILLRTATAAILNAYHPEVDYPMSVAQIISNVNTALNGNRKAMEALSKTLDKYNNLYCPLNAIKVGAKTGSLQGADNDLNVVVDKFNLTVFPNPAVRAFNVKIESASSEKIKLRIIDLQGRVIEQREGLFANQIMQIGSNYLPGVYTIQVEQGTHRKYKKLIKVSN